MVSALDSELLQEVQSLRETVEELKAALSARSRVTLQAIQQGPFLGQPVTIIVTATDGAAKNPAMNLPITITTTWGSLRAASDSEAEQNNTITARTDLNGKVEVILTPPTTEEVLDAQQAALEAALSALDINAGTPLETEASFEEMARKYKWEIEADLRDAVDIYFRDFRHKLLDSINARDYMQQWLYFDSTVIAYVIDDRGESSTLVQSTTLLNFKFKDWIGPWLEAYLKLAETENTLEADLKSIARDRGRKGAGTDDVYNKITEYIESHPGVVGEYVARKTAEKALNNFIGLGSAEVPLETKVSLTPAIQSATAALARGGVRHLAELTQTRSAAENEMIANVNSQIKTTVGAALNQVKTEADKSFKDFKDITDRTVADSLLKHENDLKDVRTKSVLTHQGELKGLRQNSAEAHSVDLTKAKDLSQQSHLTELKDLRSRSAAAHQGELDGLRQKSAEAHGLELVNVRNLSQQTHTTELKDLRTLSKTTHERELGTLRASSIQVHTTDLTDLRATSQQAHTTELANIRTNSRTLHTNELTNIRNQSKTTHEQELANVRTQSRQALETDFKNIRTREVDDFRVNVRRIADQNRRP